MPKSPVSNISASDPRADGASTSSQGGLRGRGGAAILLVLHVVALVWLCRDANRLRLLVYDFREVPNESFIERDPAALQAFGYTEDDPADLAAYRALVEPVVAGAASDVERMRRLGDFILSMVKPGMPSVDGTMRQGLSVVLAKLQSGRPATCGHVSAVLAAFWRSLGGHTRGVRWATPEGDIGHYAVELYSTDLNRWIYYDMNMNGYGVDRSGVPLSLTSLRSGLLAGEDLRFVTSPTLHPWTSKEFLPYLHSRPIVWYALNNESLSMEPGHRFGALQRYFTVLAKLPYPLDRILDNLVGVRDRELVLAGKIQIAGLFTVRGARLFVAYLFAMIGLCGLLVSRRAGGRFSV